MRKVLGLVTVLIAVFSMVTVVGAQEPANVADITATGTSNCTKCTPGNIPCPTTEEVVQGQGVTYTVTSACPFDYDDMDADSDFNKYDSTTGERYGYCALSGDGEYDSAGDPIAQRNCKFIINVCECPDACDLDIGTKVGLQMTILTKGAYWAEDPFAYQNQDGSGYRTVWFQNYEWDPRRTACNASKSDLDKSIGKNFGTVKYYEGLTETTQVDSHGDTQLYRTPYNEGYPLPGCSNTTVAKAYQMKVIQSDILTDYTVTANDASECWFWIDIPAMRIDNTATKGDAVEVRVSLLWNRELDGICPGCTPPVMCEAIRTVGYVCCEAKDIGSGYLFFPYLVQGQEDDDGWVSGVGISAVGRTELPDDAYCTLTLKDTAGNVATWTNSNLENKLVWAFVLDRVVENFSGTLVPGVVSLEIESNYRMDGYGFLMNQIWQLGAGEMPRGKDSCCP